MTLPHHHALPLPVDLEHHRLPFRQSIHKLHHLFSFLHLLKLYFPPVIFRDPDDQASGLSRSQDTGIVFCGGPF